MSTYNEVSGRALIARIYYFSMQKEIEAAANSKREVKPWVETFRPIWRRDLLGMYTESELDAHIDSGKRMLDPLTWDELEFVCAPVGRERRKDTDGTPLYADPTWLGRHRVEHAQMLRSLYTDDQLAEIEGTWVTPAKKIEGVELVRKLSCEHCGFGAHDDLEDPYGALHNLLTDEEPGELDEDAFWRLF